MDANFYVPTSKLSCCAHCLRWFWKVNRRQVTDERVHIYEEATILEQPHCKHYKLFNAMFDMTEKCADLVQCRMSKLMHLVLVF